VRHHGLKKMRRRWNGSQPQWRDSFVMAGSSVTQQRLDQKVTALGHLQKGYSVRIAIDRVFFGIQVGLQKFFVEPK
jgi:hypothetical protein